MNTARLAAAALLLSTSAAFAQDPVIVGLITKTETNPFFVKMRQGAQAEANAMGVKLLTGAGQYDGDNQTQVTLIQNYVNEGVKGILLVPSSTTAIAAQ